MIATAYDNGMDGMPAIVHLGTSATITVRTDGSLTATGGDNFVTGAGFGSGISFLKNDTDVTFNIDGHLNVQGGNPLTPSAENPAIYLDDTDATITFQGNPQSLSILPGNPNAGPTIEMINTDTNALTTAPGFPISITANTNTPIIYTAPLVPPATLQAAGIPAPAPNTTPNWSSPFQIYSNNVEAYDNYALLRVHAGGVWKLSYQWQALINNQWVNLTLPGANTSVFAYTNLQSGRHVVRCQLTDEKGNVTYTPEVSFMIP